MRKRIKPDLIIAMDLDDVCSEDLDIDVIQQYMKKEKEWDGLTFYNERYYDFWALSIRPFTLSCLHSSNGLRLIKATSQYLKSKSIIIRNVDLFIVNLLSTALVYINMHSMVILVTVLFIKTLFITVVISFRSKKPVR